MTLNLTRHRNMAKQRKRPISPEQQRRLQRGISTAVVGMFAGVARPEPFRGYIDRAACGRTAPGMDVLEIAVIGILAGLTKEQCRALPKYLLDAVDAHFPPDEPTPCAVAAAVEETEADAAADVATMEAITVRSPSAFERAALLRERQAERARRVAQSFRHLAHQSRQGTRPQLASAA